MLLSNGPWWQLGSHAAASTFLGGPTTRSCLQHAKTLSLIVLEGRNCPFGVAAATGLTGVIQRPGVNINTANVIPDISEDKRRGHFCLISDSFFSRHQANLSGGARPIQGVNLKDNEGCGEKLAGSPQSGNFHMDFIMVPWIHRRWL